MSTRVVGPPPAEARLSSRVARPLGPVLLHLVLVVLLEGCATGHPRGNLVSGFGLHSRASSLRDDSEPQGPEFPPVLARAEGSAGGFPDRTADTGRETGCLEEAARPPGWPHLSSSQQVLAPFLACTSPAQFIELQHGVDMDRLVEELDDWSAVRLGSLGPLRAGTRVLNRKRATFLVTATREYGTARAEPFALFVLHSAFGDEVKELLGLLARDKQLGETLGRMGAVREALRQRGLDLSDYPDRPEHLGDMARGLASAATEALSTSELRQGAVALKYSAQRGQLPPPFQEALDEVERAEMQQALSPGSVTLRSFDALTFGVPVGFYNLVAGTCHGVYSLSQGHYEQATRELSAAAVLVGLYAGGKGVRHLAEARGTMGTGRLKPGRLQVPELGFQGLAEVVERLWERLGGEGLRELARYIQARREAALFVHEGGESAAIALYEARGDVAKAQVWLSEARPQRAGPTPARAGIGEGLGGVASLVDEVAVHGREVVEAKLAWAEFDSTGPRLSGDVAVLEKQRPLVDAPPLGTQVDALWREYVAYWKNRLVELKQGKAVKPPLAWKGYEKMRGQFARGLAFERVMVSVLREDAALPRSMRRYLQDFNSPRIETNVGVSKQGMDGVRYADVLVIEAEPPAGQSPRVETFSFKSRNLALLEENAVAAQMVADASEALRYYGETLNILRKSIRFRVQVQRVRLIYEGGTLKPMRADSWNAAVRKAEEKVKGVEVLSQ
ncbi:hypothetical protein JRI60_18415 [Archangium violaceum]|uniref:hypothetical protein n=1 Tax=Archangium violaceum TaxID=83451 RepID=UPI00194DDB5C|nr:hypothetical protein [Archangium violaceum]QRO00860.1 hypothetical protein JRI60_18415 [Archangium violaceum]